LNLIINLRDNLDSRISVDGGQQLQHRCRPKKSIVYPFSISRVSLIFLNFFKWWNCAKI
jgi:hypothetical protein